MVVTRAEFFAPQGQNFSRIGDCISHNFKPCSLNAILPDMWKKAGIKVKTAHCLRVTCAMKLFTSGTEEKNDLRKDGTQVQCFV